MKGHVKAQVSTEFTIIMSAMLIVIVSLLSINMEILTGNENNVRIIKAKDAVDSIYKSAEHVYKQGENSKSKIFIMIPNGVNSITLNEKLIQIDLSIDGINRSVFRVTRFNITGEIPTDEGYYWLNIVSKGTYVEIS